MKICAQCKHARTNVIGRAECHAPQNKIPDLVMGGEKIGEYTYCESHRCISHKLVSDICGVEGRWFVQRDALPEPPAPTPPSSYGMRPDYARGWWQFWR